MYDGNVDCRDTPVAPICVYDGGDCKQFYENEVSMTNRGLLPGICSFSLRVAIAIVSYCANEELDSEGKVLFVW